VAAEADRNNLASAKGTKLAPYLDAWPEAHELTQQARAGYKAKIDLYVRAPLGHLALDAITGPVLTALYRKLRKQGGAGGRPLSPKTVLHVHNILSGAFNSAVKGGLLSVNPCSLAEAPRMKQIAKRKPTVWTAEQLRAFLESERESEYYPLWLFIASTGVRRGEALGLLWENVNLDGGTATLYETVGVSRGKIIREETPKDKEARTVQLAESVARTLKAHRHAQNVERLRLGSRWVDEGLVFPRTGYRLLDGHTAGGPLNGDKVTALFKRRADALGLPVIRLHDMRHGWATLALEAGVPLKVVQEQLGHSSYHVTANLYSHVRDKVQREATETVTRLFA
jgi:integrase